MAELISHLAMLATTDQGNLRDNNVMHTKRRSHVHLEWRITCRRSVIVDVIRLKIVPHYLNIGGLVAIGFDPTGEYMLTITHSGRGVYRIGTWERLTRDIELAYPEDGIGVGIGPIVDQKTPINELNYDTGVLELATPDRKYNIHYAEGTVTIETAK